MSYERWKSFREVLWNSLRILKSIAFLGILAQAAQVTKIDDFSEPLHHSWARRPKLPKLLLVAQMDSFGDSLDNFSPKLPK